MKNKHGFTLVELMAVIVILAIIIAIAVPVYNKVQKNINEKNYENKVKLIETAATKYAEDTHYETMYVDDLITSGYLDADNEKGEIFNNVTKEKINCYIVQVVLEKGNYYAKLIEKSYEEEGKCSSNIPNEYNKILKIKMVNVDNEEEIKKENSHNWWTRKDVKLIPIVQLSEGQIIEKIEWYEGSFSKNPIDENIDDKNNLLVSTNSVLQQNYIVKVTLNDGKVYSAAIRVYIDKIAPKFYKNDKEQLEKNGWVKEINYNVKAYDNESGIYGYKLVNQNTECSTNKEEYTKEKISIKENGTYKICIMDNVGNVYGETREINNIDNIKPSCSITILNSPTEFTYNNETWYNSTPEIQIEYSDVYRDSEGKEILLTDNIKSRSYSWINEYKNTNYKNDNFLGNTLKIDEEGINNLDVTVTDQSGNVSDPCSITLKVDNVQPKIVTKNNDRSVSIKYGTDKKLDDYFKISTSYGPTGGTTSCYSEGPSRNTAVSNNSSLGMGIHKIVCKMQGNNKLTGSDYTYIKHSSTNAQFTCKDNYVVSGNTCKGGTGACLEYNKVCESWNCKTRENREDPSCGCSSFKCKTAKTCLTSCKADNDSVSDNDTNSLCESQVGKVKTQIKSDGTELRVIWYNFRLPYHGRGGGGVLCYIGSSYSGAIKVGTKAGSNVISCSSSKGHDHSEGTNYIGKFGYESGNNNLGITQKYICVDPADSSYTFTNTYSDTNSANLCNTSWKCGLKLDVTFSTSKLTANKRNFIMIGAEDQLEAYHSICTPTFSSDASKCGCKTYYTVSNGVSSETCNTYKSCNVCTVKYTVADGISSKTCSSIKNGTTCLKYDTKEDATKKSYYLNGTNYSTNTAISATCDSSGNCQF